MSSSRGKTLFMIFELKTIALIVLAIIVVYVGYQTIRIRNLIAISQTLINATEPFQGAVDEAEYSMLVLGDSTAYGVGAESPEKSLPGRVAILLNANVENHAKSGATVDYVSGQIKSTIQKEYDYILIQAGANDIVGLGSLGETAASMDALLGHAKEKSDRVIFLTAGKVGKAPLFPKLFGWIFTHRAKELRARFLALAEKHDALYVDIYAAPDHFSGNKAKYYAIDTFHPSGDGYGLWFDTTKEALKKKWPELVHEE